MCPTKKISPQMCEMSPNLVALLVINGEPPIGTKISLQLSSGGVGGNISAQSKARTKTKTNLRTVQIDSLSRLFVANLGVYQMVYPQRV
jgi:hypothetical protein